MKERLFIIAALGGMIILMVLLNAASYTQKVKQPDSEATPNRSTFNPGATGTMAYYSLLNETGRRVTRWQSAPDALSVSDSGRPSVYVIVGPLKREISDSDATAMLQWVSSGGRLVLIDRDPPKQLIVTDSEWTVSVEPRVSFDIATVDPANQTQMTAETVAARPVQPTALTAAVNAVQPSRFASSIKLQRSSFVDNEAYQASSNKVDYPKEVAASLQDEEADNQGAPQAESSPSGRSIVGTPPPAADDYAPTDDLVYFGAPVVHVGSAERDLLADMPYGNGSITVLSDPYIVSNGGIAAADNARLAVNLAASDGLIAFDEYHQGFGSGTNRVIEYFEGTPVAAIFLQAIAFIAVVFYSRSRRFARPLPDGGPDRLAKLEYVSAMAELQQRARAFDLAMENIYGDFRRRTARYFGIDGMAANRGELAALLSERFGLDRAELAATFSKCEEISHGEPSDRGEVLRLVGRLRELEELMRSGLVKGRHGK